MDIPAKSWEAGRQYSKNDIVRMGNLAFPKDNPYKDENGNAITPMAGWVDEEKSVKEIIREDEVILSVESLAEADIVTSTEIPVGVRFEIIDSIDYLVGGMVRKGSKRSDTVDPYQTLIKETTNDSGVLIVDVDSSIGVGVGIKFYDITGEELEVNDLRHSHRLMASSELNTTEYYNVQLYIESKNIPTGAVAAQTVAFVYGIKAVSRFDFKTITAQSASPFFYCIEDHLSSLDNEPNKTASTAYWTQDFVWKPAYNSKADFAAINESVKLGEGHDYVTNLAINSLPMQLSLTFDNRTDREARAIIHYLQEKFFPYDSIFGLDYKGNRLLASDVSSFRFKYTYPYRENLRFTCIRFNHSETYRNNNTISATFVCRTESTLDSLESNAGYNKRTDALVPIAITKKTLFEKGKQMTLNTWALDDDDPDNPSSTTEDITKDIENITRYPTDPTEPILGGLLKFYLPTTLIAGDCVHITVDKPETSRFNVGLTRITSKLSDTELVFTPILDQGSISNVESALIPIGIEDGSQMQSDTFLQDPVDRNSDFAALEESLDLTPAGPTGWYYSSWFFKTNQSEISGNAWYIAANTKWTYTDALGGAWIYVEPLGDKKLWIWHEALGWNFANAKSFSGSNAFTYNNDLSAVGSKGWVYWADPSGDPYEAKVYNYTDKLWYNVNLELPKIEPSPDDDTVPPPDIDEEAPPSSEISIISVADITSTLPKPFKVLKLDRCPSDCLTNKPLIPDGIDVIKAAPIDPDTGERKGSQIYLKNYRKIQIDSDIKPDTGTVKITPLETFEMDESFQMLIPAVRGKSSIYLADPSEYIQFPWLEVRNFQWRPSLTFTLEQTPKHIQSKFVEYYNKSFKKGINQNLSTFNIVFDQRSDKEAAQILQFLESHLGYKKFRFQMPRPYLKDDNYTTTQTRPNMSTFYCPSWGHDIAYKNNHRITATFIESATSIEEDVRKALDPKGGPCFGAEIYDPITMHELCTFSSILEAALGPGFNADGSAGTRAKAVDLIFIVDASGSMWYNNINTKAVSISKFQATMDTIMKMVTSFDHYIMPGSESYGNIFNCPPITAGSASGNDAVPPWPAHNRSPYDPRKREGAIDSWEKLLTDPNENVTLNELLEQSGYNLSNLDRFNIKIEENGVNIGIVIMGDTGVSAIDVSQISESYDKNYIYQTAKWWKDSNGKNASGRQASGENYPDSVSLALAQLYNSPRAEYVTDRIIVMLSDGVTSNDAPGPTNCASPRSTVPNSWNEPTLQMCRAIRKGGELSKRRPPDAILKKYGCPAGGVYSPYTRLQEYALQDKGDGKSALVNPDNGVGKNPTWYKEEIPTMFMMATIGESPSKISSHSPRYCYDYDPANPGKVPQFYFPITDGGASDKEVERLIKLIHVVSQLTSATDDGTFSIILHNCGINDVRLLNTIVSDEANAPLRYTTARLEGGMPKGGEQYSLEYITSPDNYKLGYGGQFYNDPNNKDLTRVSDDVSNILWESFTTQYEVIRSTGPENIDGGWKNHSSESLGVRNIGVAYKGMPVRVFKTSAGTEIIDYNIGNATKDNNYLGDYSHLPVLKPGEDIQLFFSARTTSKSKHTERIQFFFNSDDGTSRKMECYANIDFPVTATKPKPNKERAPIKEPLPDPDLCEEGFAEGLEIVKITAAKVEPPPPQGQGCTGAFKLVGPTPMIGCEAEVPGGWWVENASGHPYNWTYVFTTLRYTDGMFLINNREDFSIKIRVKGYLAGVYTPPNIKTKHSWFTHEPGHIGPVATCGKLMAGNGQSYYGYAIAFQEKKLAEVLLEALQETCKEGDPFEVVENGLALNIKPSWMD